jgi:hypothetical protein
MSKKRPNRYFVGYAGVREELVYEKNVYREFRSKPAAYDYAESRGYGYRVAEIPKKPNPERGA